MLKLVVRLALLLGINAMLGLGVLYVHAASLPAYAPWESDSILLRMPDDEDFDLVFLGASARTFKGRSIETRPKATGIVMSTSFPFYDPMWQDCRVMTPRGVECWNNEDMKLLSRASPIDGEGEGLVDEPSPEAGVNDPNI